MCAFTAWPSPRFRPANTTVDTTVNEGTVYVQPGGIVSNTVVNSGSFIHVSGAAVSTTIHSGFQVIQSGRT